MAIKPILFNTEMVRAILDGRKSCTRRIVKHDVEAILNSPYHKEHPEVEDEQIISKLCIPPYQPGDILYVRETWCKYDDDHIIDGRKYAYKADASPISEEARKKFGYRWRPSIHMPKEAARIWLKVTDVRVERLQSITEEGAIREGAEGEKCHHINAGAFGCTDCMNTGWIEPPQVEFMQIWDSTIKKSDLDRYGWNANPYVWVIEFERCG